MQAIKKPIPIEVEEFDPNHPPFGVTVDIQPGGPYKIYNALHASWIELKPGDYVNVTDPQGRDYYPIDRATFFRTYDLVEARRG